MTHNKSLFRKKNIPLLILISAALCFFVFSVLTIKVVASNQTRMPEKLLTRIQIQHGDTLWKIASAYHSSEYISMIDYIAEIQRCNGISSDQIHAGRSLIIPYYAAE